MDVNKLIQEIIILAPPFLLGLTVHEYAHGYVAYRFGDPTAKAQGRLTMNPIKHIDPIGALAFIIMKIGWAKPVPVNPAYFKNPARDMLWVSFAGPGANMLTAIASGIILKLMLLLTGIVPMFIFMPVAKMLAASVWINVMLGIFNLVPIPPLDGSKIVVGLLPSEMAAAYAKLEPFGFVILLVLFYTGVISKVFLPLINFAQGLILG